MHVDKTSFFGLNLILFAGLIIPIYLYCVRFLQKCEFAFEPYYRHPVGEQSAIYHPLWHHRIHAYKYPTHTVPNEKAYHLVHTLSTLKYRLTQIENSLSFYWLDIDTNMRADNQDLRKWIY